MKIEEIVSLTVLLFLAFAPWDLHNFGDESEEADEPTNITGGI
jgi:hypothetical protein